MGGGVGGNCIHDLLHSDTYCSNKTGGSVLRTVGQYFTQVCRQKDISGCQSCFLSGGGGFPDQANTSRILIVTWTSHV